MPTDADELNAYNEWGHAVVARRFGIAVEKVSMITKGNPSAYTTLGRVCHEAHDSDA
jgi:secreted PhoX family phosphatase